MLNRLRNTRRQAIALTAGFLLTCGAPLLADNTLDLSEYHGKVVLIDFWASWCVPCRRSFPWMNEMHDKYVDDGLVIIGVNLDTETDDALSFLSEYPPKFKITNDPEGKLAIAYDIIAMPSSFIYGRDGEFVTKHLGFKVRNQDEYEMVLKEALAEKVE